MVLSCFFPHFFFIYHSNPFSSFSGSDRNSFFLLPFFGLRLFCGGYHAKTYSRCFISTNFTYLLTLCGAKLISFLSTMSFMLFFACLAFLIIFFWSPIRNYRHPLSEKRYQHNRKIARWLSILYVSLSFIFYSTFSGMIFLMFTLSGMAVAILMIKPKLQESPMV